MSQQIYKVKLAGKSQLHEPQVTLEDITINLWSIDGGETWENKNAMVEVSGQLKVTMSCKAISGTGWDFIITNKSTDAKVVETKGTTGEDGTPNFSEKILSVNP